MELGFDRSLNYIQTVEIALYIDRIVMMLFCHSNFSMNSAFPLGCKVSDSCCFCGF